MDTWERRLGELLELWAEETRYHSSITAIANHPSRAAITAAGKSTLPSLLRHIESYPHQVMICLAEITGISPIPHEDAGRVDRMIASWQAWGKKYGYA